MRDFEFSSSQTFTNTNSTGEVSENIWDIEENGPVDNQVLGWINITVLSATISGLTEGLIIELRSSDNTNISTTPLYLGALQLGPTEIVAGKQFAFGVCRANLKKYVGGWARAVNTANTGAIVLDIEFNTDPVIEMNIQKKPV